MGKFCGKEGFFSTRTISNLCLLRQKIKGQYKRVSYLDLDLEEDLINASFVVRMCGEKVRKRIRNLVQTSFLAEVAINFTVI